MVRSKASSTRRTFDTTTAVDQRPHVSTFPKRVGDDKPLRRRRRADRPNPVGRFPGIPGNGINGGGAYKSASMPQLPFAPKNKRHRPRLRRAQDSASLGRRSTGTIQSLPALPSATAVLCGATPASITATGEGPCGSINIDRGCDGDVRFRQNRCSSDDGGQTIIPPADTESSGSALQGVGGGGPRRIWCCPSTSAMREEARANLSGMAKPDLWRSPSVSGVRDAARVELESMRGRYRAENKVGA